MQSLPIFLKLAGKQVAVIGGGTAAARKCEAAIRCGAQVTAYAEKLGGDFHELLTKANFRHEPRQPVAADLAGAAIVFCATEKRNRRSRGASPRARCRRAGQCRRPAGTLRFHHAVDPRSRSAGGGDRTEGNSPILGRMLKARLETEIPSAYGRLAEFAGRQRDALAEVLPSGVERRRFWERILEGPIAELVLAGRNAPQKKFANALAEVRAGREPSAGGEVYLVGAGPGDPDLVTFRAFG